MKKMLIVVVALALVGGGAAALLPVTTWGSAAPKEAKLPKDFGAYVLNVSDGRTMAISVSNELYSLRVKGITLPTSAEAAHEADLALRTLVFGRNILVENATKAADGVYEGDVRVGPDHVAEAQVSAGLASVSGGSTELAALQETAKSNKVGMWAPAEPVPDTSTQSSAAEPQPAAKTL
ncbi:thermonuclease family protein [Uliginosibacterium sp. H3]|uniref:Thermonuclease family protein n=1 Tax=Uliginosibacterium silvisoli TaxID=3114758 RepID=A0ABU6K9P9_9RHOO|nr:thermonuclease family protein [Uliginosibacterium sp. H3]